MNILIKNSIKILTVISLLVQGGAILPYDYSGSENYNYYGYNDNFKYTPNDISDKDILLIVDYSNSMHGKIGASKKINCAINAIEEIMRNIDSSTKIGLRLFGLSAGPEQIRPGEYKLYKNEICSSSELILPVAPYNNKNIAARLREFTPRGATPIGYSLRQAVQYDFPYGSKMKHIILITDGDENCGDDPCAFIKYIMQSRNDIRIDVIGITLNPNEYSRLQCIADAGKGKFYDVRTENDFHTKFLSVIDPSYSTALPEVKQQNTSYSSHNNEINYKNYAFEIKE